MMDCKKKRIALNTIYLYSKGFIALFIGLYISRVLLHQLGVVDFGLYGVVGGIIGLLSFINTAMTSTSSRYITFALAKDDKDYQKLVFSATFYIHLAIALFLLFLAETIGLWYLNTKLEVPEERMGAASWVYQMSIIIAMINITQVPYNATILAHEKMGFMSIWGIISDFFRLFSVLILTLITYDKLIFYSLLTLIVNIVSALGNRIYCKKFFSECKFCKVKNKKLLFEMFSFAGYSCFNSFSLVIRNNSIVLLINKFFGVIMNASGNIAGMVSGNIAGFTQNVVSAFRPQIVKSYAVNDINEMQNNINNCSKYCIALYSMLAVPAFIEISYLLQLWLIEVPIYSNIFCRINLIGSLFSLNNMILVIGIQATSKVKRNSIQICILSIISICVNLIFLFLGANVFTVFVIVAFTEFLIMCVSLSNLKSLIPGFNITVFSKQIANNLFIVILSGAIVYTLSLIYQSSFLRLVITTLSYEIIFSLLFYHFMLDIQTQKMIINNIQKKIFNKSPNE